MATINLGSDPTKDQGMGDLTIKPTGAPPADVKTAEKIDIGLPAGNAKPAAADSISINFTPTVTTAGSEKAATSTPAPQLISMEIKRSDLDKKDEKTAQPAAEIKPEKKGLLGGLFGKKTEPATMTKPSTAWGNALDKDMEVKPVVSAAAANLAASVSAAATPAKPAIASTTEAVKPAGKVLPEKNDFFTSASLQEKAGGSKLVENIATQKAKLEQPKMEELLGKKSTILEKSIEQESLLKTKKKLRLMQVIAFLVTAAVVAVNGFLFYQLSPGLNLLGFNFNFDSNLRNDVFNLNQSLKSTQTDLNKYRFLTGQLYLNQFGYESTRFIDGIANLETPGPTTDKTTLESDMTDAKTQMPTLLAGAQANLTNPISVDTYATRGETATDPATIDATFQKDLKTAIIAEKTALETASAQNKEEVPADQLAFFDNTIKLIGNQKLVTNLNSMTVDAFKLEADDYQTNSDPAQRLAFKTYIDNLLASTKVNLATITNLRNARVHLSDVMDAIERITNQVNSEHNSGLGAANASKIVYSGIDFDAQTNRLTLSALNTTNTGTNREVVTYLMEAFEASPEFKDVSNRTFPLTKNVDDQGTVTYDLSFKMDLTLENGAFSKLNSPIADLQNGTKVAQLKIPVKIKKSL